MSKFTTFTTNPVGEDFICSDIHGNFELLESYLSEIEFNPAEDRLFCLGDLIDRSEHSPLAFEYLKKPWFYSILGNHEMMLIDAFEKKDEILKQLWHRCGGHWAIDLTLDELEPYYNALIELPIGIELELYSGKKVGLIHAGLPENTDWNDIKQSLSVLPKSGFDSNTELLQIILWDRPHLYNPASVSLAPVQNIDHVFHGHTIVYKMLLIENRSYIDLGSYNNARLGLVHPDDYLEQLQNTNI